jgi:hypothetical protein
MSRQAAHFADLREQRARAAVIVEAAQEEHRAAVAELAVARERQRAAGADGDAKADQVELLEERANRAAAGVGAAQAHLEAATAALNRAEAAYQHSSEPGPPPQDWRSYNLRPDPLAAHTPAEFVEMLRRYRIWAGEPSYRDMASQCRQAVAASTLCTALGRNDLPRLRVVLAIIAGCGGTEEDQQQFATAWRRIRLPPEAPAVAARPPLRMVPPSSRTG